MYMNKIPIRHAIVKNRIKNIERPTFQTVHMYQARCQEFQKHFPIWEFCDNARRTSKGTAWGFQLFQNFRNPENETLITFRHSIFARDPVLNLISSLKVCKCDYFGPYKNIIGSHQSVRKLNFSVGRPFCGPFPIEDWLRSVELPEVTCWRQLQMKGKYWGC